MGDLADGIALGERLRDFDRRLGEVESRTWQGVTEDDLQPRLTAIHERLDALEPPPPPDPPADPIVIVIEPPADPDPDPDPPADDPPADDPPPAPDPSPDPELIPPAPSPRAGSSAGGGGLALGG